MLHGRQLYVIRHGQNHLPTPEAIIQGPRIDARALRGSALQQAATIGRCIRATRRWIAVVHQSHAAGSRHRRWAHPRIGWPTCSRSFVAPELYEIDFGDLLWPHAWPDVADTASSPGGRCLGPWLHRPSAFPGGEIAGAGATSHPARSLKRLMDEALAPTRRRPRCPRPHQPHPLGDLADGRLALADMDPLSASKTPAITQIARGRRQVRVAAPAQRHEVTLREARFGKTGLITKASIQVHASSCASWPACSSLPVLPAAWLYVVDAGAHADGFRLRRRAPTGSRVGPLDDREGLRRPSCPR